MVLFTSVTYLFYNWKFVSLNPLSLFFSSSTHLPSGNYQFVRQKISWKAKIWKHAKEIPQSKRWHCHVPGRCEATELLRMTPLHGGKIPLGPCSALPFSQAIYTCLPLTHHHLTFLETDHVPTCLSGISQRYKISSAYPQAVAMNLVELKEVLRCSIPWQTQVLDLPEVQSFLAKYL